jgi:8-oxo-dGTP pyrophosphatase MutT (NUDIX family)
MEKFTKLKPKDYFADPKDKVLYDDKHFQIVQFEDWSVLKSKDCIICIPYLIESNEIILRQEYIPSFKYVDGSDYYLTLVCGGIEQGETPEIACLRELEEEAGIVLREDYKLEPLKPLFVNKSLTSKYFPYIIPLHERDYHEVIAKGDGSRIEEISKAVRVNAKFLSSLNPSDMMTDYMLLKLKEYLNL